MAPTAFFLTYTMLNPVVAGAFFRALRLACELDRRGWHSVIANHGPPLTDPKIDHAPDSVRFCSVDADLSIGEHDMVAVEEMQRYVASFEPDVVILGEGPFAAMEPYVTGAQAVDVPFVVLDQYYNGLLRPNVKGVDLMLLYGLRSFWKDLHLPRPSVMVPPFIQAVTPSADLPVPSAWHSTPRSTPHSTPHSTPKVLLIAYETPVLAQGIELITGLTDLDASFIVVSPQPAEAEALLAGAGIEPERWLALPVLPDEDIYGLTALAQVTLVSSGFIQIMDTLAMGSPVVALPRGGPVGMTELNIEERFRPYVAFGVEMAALRQRARQWLHADPFDARLRASLAQERCGTSRCADLIEDLVLRGRLPFRRQPLRRALTRLMRHFS